MFHVAKCVYCHFSFRAYPNLSRSLIRVFHSTSSLEGMTGMLGKLLSWDARKYSKGFNALKIKRGLVSAPLNGLGSTPFGKSFLFQWVLTFLMQMTP